MTVRKLLVACICLIALLGSAARATAAPWILVSDLHVDFDYHAPLWGRDVDTSAELFDDLLRQMKQVDPDAPVIIVSGDFVAHAMPRDRVLNTIREATRRLNAAFPKAQFVLTLGNNDSTCGDYETQHNGAFLSEVARAWQPLVSRGGGASDFIRSFSATGSYVAHLPQHVDAAVLDDVPFAFRYADVCAGDGSQFVPNALASLGRDLTPASSSKRTTWIVTHLPPGLDTYTSTHVTRQIFSITFLRANAQAPLMQFAKAPQNRVSLMIAGHTHKFAFRDADGIPAVLVPSVSPLMQNNPSFLLLQFDANGTPGRLSEWALEGETWSRFDDTRAMGMRAIDIDSIRSLNERMEDDSALLDRFARDYTAGGDSELTQRNWRGYWCAQTTVDFGRYRNCIASGSAGQLRTRWQLLLAVIASAFIALVALAIRLLIRRRTARA